MLHTDTPRSLYNVRTPDSTAVLQNYHCCKDLRDMAIANNMSAVQDTDSRLLRSLPSVCGFMS